MIIDTGTLRVGFTFYARNCNWPIIGLNLKEIFIFNEGCDNCVQISGDRTQTGTLLHAREINLLDERNKSFHVLEKLQRMI